MQSSVLILLERVTLMSTYEEFMVILAVALLIVAILNYKNKQATLSLVRSKQLAYYENNL